MQNAINYIESHLLDDIDQDDTAKNAYLSVYQFHRAFRMIAGITISEYIRNHKLPLAGRELRERKERVIDIALKYGYIHPKALQKHLRGFMARLHRPFGRPARRFGLQSAYHSNQYKRWV